MTRMFLTTRRWPYKIYSSRFASFVADFLIFFSRFFVFVRDSRFPHFANPSCILRKFSRPIRHPNRPFRRILYRSIKFLQVLCQNCDLFRQQNARFIVERGESSERRFNDMENRENQLEARDFGLLLFVVVAGWLLLFQSGLFS